MVIFERDIHSPCSEVVEKFPPLRESICAKLISILSLIKSAKVFRGVFWILGEYTDDLAEISSTFQEIRKVIGEIPILASEQRAAEETAGDTEENSGDKLNGKAEGGRPRVLADGTYATESAYTTTKTETTTKAANKAPLRGDNPAKQVERPFNQTTSAHLERRLLY